MMLEVICLRLLAITDAYNAGSYGNPDWSNTKHFGGTVSSTDLVSGEMRGYVNRHAKDELETQALRTRVGKHGSWQDAGEGLPGGAKGDNGKDNNKNKDKKGKGAGAGAQPGAADG